MGGAGVRQSFYDAVMASPVIAAVKDEAGLDDCLRLEDIRVVFLLFGDICNIGALVERVKAAEKLAFVHTDLIAGLSTSKEITVDFIKNATRADGIISTRPNLIRRARELELYTVYRIFVIDSIALAGVEKAELLHPDFVEILPGVMPKTIRKVCALIRTPVLAGGLITDKEDVMAALGAGAAAISSTNPEVWAL